MHSGVLLFILKQGLSSGWSSKLASEFVAILLTQPPKF